MNGMSRKIWPAAAAAAIVLAMLQVAGAQPGEGRRGRGGPDGRGFGLSPLRLASVDEVQEALKLSDDQKEKVEEINDKVRDDFRKVLGEGGRGEEMQKLNQDTTAKLNEVLDEQQRKRLKGISVQVLGPNIVLLDPEIAKELNVTDEQKAKLADVQESNMESMRDAFREMQDLSGDERRTKFEELRADANKKLLAELTSQQQEQLETLKGEKVEIDMSQLRGPGRGGFGGRGDRDRDRDRDRNRDRDRGNRDRDDAESKDAPSDN